MEKVNRSIFAFGLNYQTAPLAVREKCAFDLSRITDVLKSFQSGSGADEVLILSTCNRTELYFFAPRYEEVMLWFANYFGLQLEDLEEHIYIHENEGALEHAAKVASGLDSMVIGETQILGQIKDAYRKSQDAETLGLNLNKFFQTAFSIAKEVRTNTEVGAHSVSLPAAALKASERIFRNLLDCRVLFIGAGEMIRLCSERFFEVGLRKFTFINRSLQNAEHLARNYHANVLSLDSLPISLPDFDIIVSCTASPVPILGKGTIEGALKVRKHKPMVIFDLAVPRDVEEAVSELEDIFLFSVDDLGEIVNEGLQSRKLATDEAHTLIQRGVDNFSSWVKSRETVPVIRAFRDYGEQIVDEELKDAIAQLDRKVPPDVVINKLARSIRNRFLHRPCGALGEASPEDKVLFSRVLRRLFKLDDFQ